nr:uncharacterized protein LOC116777942 [Danaus plexippus plexippus]
MAGHLRFLQANGNHCAGAQDLFLQSMVEWAVDVAVMSEPYYVPAQPHWVGDADGSVAIVTRPGAVPPLAVKARGHGYVAAGYVAAVRGEIAIVGVYFSPNRDLPAFERFLDKQPATLKDVCVSKAGRSSTEALDSRGFTDTG